MSRIQHIQRNETGQLVVTVEGGDGPYVDARIARCFPWSRPDEYISVCDSDGEEIELLDTLDELEESSRTLVREEIHDKVFSPTILRVVEHKSEFGIISVTAETDRGQVSFQIRSRDDIRALSPTRVLFRDADGNVYEVPDVDALDLESRKHVEQYL